MTVLVHGNEVFCGVTKAQPLKAGDVIRNHRFRGPGKTDDTYTVTQEDVDRGYVKVTEYKGRSGWLIQPCFTETRPYRCIQSGAADRPTVTQIDDGRSGISYGDV